METFVIIQLNNPIGNIQNVNLIAQPSGQQFESGILASSLLTPTQYLVPDGTTAITVIASNGPCIGTQTNLSVVYPTTTTTTSTTTTTTTITTSTTTTTTTICAPTGDIQTVNSSPSCFTSPTWQQRIRISGTPSVGNKYYIGFLGINNITYTVTSPSDTNQNIANSLIAMINAIPSVNRQSTGCSQTITVTASLGTIPLPPNTYRDILLFIDSQHSAAVSYYCN